MAVKIFLFSHREHWCVWAILPIEKTPGERLVLQFIPKVFSGVEVRAQDTRVVYGPCRYGPHFVHSMIKKFEPFGSSKKNLNATTYKDIIYSCVLTALLQQFKQKPNMLVRGLHETKNVCKECANAKNIS